MSVVVKVCGSPGTGKSIIARIISKALFDSGFNVFVNKDLDDELLKKQFEKSKKALKGTTVHITCIQTKLDDKNNCNYPNDNYNTEEAICTDCKKPFIKHVLQFTTSKCKLCESANPSKKIQTIITEGDITTIYSDALITAINSGGLWFGGIDNAIRKVAGNEFHSKLLVQKTVSLTDGTAVITHNNGTQLLPFKNVIFVVDDLQKPLSEIIIAGLKAADRREYKMITIPAIRTGVMKGIKEKTDQEVADQYKIAINQCKDMAINLKIVIYNDPDFATLLRNTLS